MTSPDNKALEEYNRAMGEKVGAWGIPGDIVSMLINSIPFIGDIVRAITGVVGGAFNTLSTWANQLLSAARGIPVIGWITAPIQDFFFHQTAVANTATQAANTGSNIIATLISAFTRGGVTGTTPAQLAPVVAGFENRVTVLEGGAVTEWLVTSSTTLDLSAYTDYDVVLIGASQPGQAGSSSGFGGSSPGGMQGGFIRAQGKVADLPNPTVVSLVIGTNSGRSIFGANADGTDGTLKTVPGKAASANGPVFDPTESAPGSGGYGGQGGRVSTNNSSGQGATNGGDGESSVTSIGGAGGALGKGGAWGGNGESSNVQGSGAKAGGAGGGGGGGGNFDNLSYPGGQGGNGGYPGGGPGGGGMGGKGSLQGPASGGGPGATANGFAFVRATGLVTP